MCKLVHSSDQLYIVSEPPPFAWTWTCLLMLSFFVACLIFFYLLSACFDPVQLISLSRTFTARGRQHSNIKYWPGMNTIRCVVLLWKFILWKPNLYYFSFLIKNKMTCPDAVRKSNLAMWRQCKPPNPDTHSQTAYLCDIWVQHLVFVANERGLKCTKICDCCEIICETDWAFRLLDCFWRCAALLDGSRNLAEKKRARPFHNYCTAVFPVPHVISYTFPLRRQRNEEGEANTYTHAPKQLPPSMWCSQLEPPGISLLFSRLVVSTHRFSSNLTRT